MGVPPKPLDLEIDGRTVSITNPEKVFFPERGYTKLDLVNYYMAVAEGAIRGVYKRPMVLKRFVNGADKDPFFQKRAPSNLPDWMYTSLITFPSGRSADLVVVEERCDLAWVVNTGCIDLNPWPVRVDDVDRPDELRVDLDPTPEATWAMVREVALSCNEVLTDFGFKGFPKTSGSRGIHINVRIEPKWEFSDVRKCALALAREVERRVPEIATTKWWKEERHGVFIDYNQNARDRTVASAYSVRPTPEARVSCPMEWSEVPACEMEAFTIETVPRRFKEIGDPADAIDDAHYSLEPLLELSEKQKRDGQGEAPYPPHFPKTAGEPKRVQPSRARNDDGTPRFTPSRNRWGRQQPKG